MFSENERQKEEILKKEGKKTPKKTERCAESK